MSGELVCSEQLKQLGNHVVSAFLVKKPLYTQSQGSCGPEGDPAPAMPCLPFPGGFLLHVEPVSAPLGRGKAAESGIKSLIQKLLRWRGWEPGLWGYSVASKLASVGHCVTQSL